MVRTDEQRAFARCRAQIWLRVDQDSGNTGADAAARLELSGLALLGMGYEHPRLAVL